MANELNDNEPSRPLGRWSRVVLAAVILLINLPLLHFYVLRGPQPVTKTIPFVDDFNRAALGDGYWSTGGLWRIVNGQLLSPGVKNNPLWLEAALPDDVIIELDVKNETAGGDIRAELFGDGRDHASGYVLIHGAGGSSVSLIARLDENAQGAPADSDDARWRVQTSATPVVPGRTYHWRIERRGKTITWFIDGVEHLRLEDPRPLSGKGHDRFGVSSWESQLFFDNFNIRPADGSVAAAPKPTPVAEPFNDDFNRSELGTAWNVTGADSVTLSNGQLHLRNSHNRPTWLTKPIPQNGTIEFDATADSEAGDIKVEAWGDGRSFYSGDLRLQYTATGYVFILGGWKNSASTIARHSEHLPEQPMRRDFKVEPNRTYHWKLQREGARISWFIDGTLFLEFVDAQPLTGPGNAYFAFSGWEAPTHFDNLVIR